jgi:hypothetical protein
MVNAYSKPLAARHGRGTAWAQHAMCESALRDVELGRIGMETVVGCLKKRYLEIILEGQRRETTNHREGSLCSILDSEIITS